MKHFLSVLLALALLSGLVLSVSASQRKLGDVNGNDRIDNGDYLMVKRYVLKTYPLDAAQLKSADVSGDNAVNATDYLRIKRAVLKTYVISGYVSIPEETDDPSGGGQTSGGQEQEELPGLSFGCYEGTYYDAVTPEALNSTELLRETLHTILADGSVRRTDKQAFSDLETADCFDGTFVECLYTGERMNADAHGYWNREHVWAKSHGFPSEGLLAHTDLHHLRATVETINSARGSKYFDDVAEPTGGDESGNRWTDASFEPRDEVKGDVARMMFYMVVRYEGFEEDDRLDLELTDDAELASWQTDYEGPESVTKAYFGVLSTLIRWSFEDPVDSKEIARNEAVYAIQKNRNPFIDYPELVFYLYPDECDSLGYTQEELEDLITYNLKDDGSIGSVETLIEGIEGAEDKKTAVEAARAAYDALTYESQCFVSNYALLVEAEKLLEGQTGEGSVTFSFTDLGGAKEGDLIASGVSLHYRSTSDNAPNTYGLYSQAGKNVVLTAKDLKTCSGLSLKADSNKADGVTGTVSVTDGVKTVSEAFTLYKNQPSDCILDISGLDASKTWTVTVDSGSSWRISEITFERES